MKNLHRIISIILAIVLISSLSIGVYATQLVADIPVNGVVIAGGNYNFQCTTTFDTSASTGKAKLKLRNTSGTVPDGFAGYVKVSLYDTNGVMRGSNKENYEYWYVNTFTKEVQKTVTACTIKKVKAEYNFLGITIHVKIITT